MLSSFSGQPCARAPDTLVRSPNHGLTYLFPRAISAAAALSVAGPNDEIISASSIVVHVLLIPRKVTCERESEPARGARTTIVGEIAAVLVDGENRRDRRSLTRIPPGYSSGPARDRA